MSSTEERRMAALANQRAAAFVRFQLLGDHEAMHYLLQQSAQDETARLAFVTALGSIAGSLGTRSLGREALLDYLHRLAASSAALHDADDIDGWFDAG